MGKKRLYTCTRCSYSTESSQRIQFHILANKNSEIVYCHSCDFTACTPLILAAHRRMKHEERRPSKKRTTANKLCVKPKVTHPKFLTAKSRVQTMRFSKIKPQAIANKIQRDHNSGYQQHQKPLKITSLGTASVTLNSIGDWINEDKPFKCCYCPYRSDSMSEVQAHLKMHQTEKKVDPVDQSQAPSTSSESDCSETTEELSSVEGDAETTESEDEEAYEDSDNAEGTQCNSLTEELSGSEPYQGSNTSLYSCSFCPYSSPKRDRVRNHERVHTGERPFRCNLCDYTATWQSNLSAHMLRHMKSNPPVPDCSKYQNRTAGPERERKYLCSYCDHRSFTRQHLDRHESAHLKGTLRKKSRLEVLDTLRERRHPCSFCSHRSYTKQDLDRHEAALHEGYRRTKVQPEKPRFKLKVLPGIRSSRERRYQCSFCPHRSFRRHDLVRHELIHGQNRR